MVRCSTRGLTWMRVFRTSSVPTRKQMRICTFGLALLLLAPLIGWTEQSPSPPLTFQITLGSSSRGEALFMGRVQLRNRGPACISCHTIGGLSFPNGGTLGPDLTHVYARLGQPGAQAAIQTLYFGVMTPIYDRHPLTADEQADLLAFLKQSESSKRPQWITQILILAAIVVAGIFLIITALRWRRRVRSVRRALVDRVRKQGAL